MATLKDKVKQKAGKAVATTTEKPKTLAGQLAQMVPQFARAMPKHLDADRLARIALTEYRRNPGLAAATPESFFGALMQSAQLGLEPGLVGHCYLLPFKNKRTGTTEIQFVIGYKGMLDLVRRSGEVIGTPKARIVYEMDEFNLEYNADGDVFRHEPWYMTEGVANGGAIRGAYVQVRYKAGGGDIWFYPISQIEARRARSMAKDSGPWKTDYEAMVLKTAIRITFPWLPVSIEMRQAAAEADESVTLIDADSLDVTTIQVEEAMEEPAQVEAPKEEKQPEQEKAPEPPKTQDAEIL